jgi:uncharacterized protein YegP (UPF0339 family)
MYFRVYLDRAGEWRWTLFAANGRKIADSAEGYMRYDNCVHGVRLVMQTSTSTPVV